MNEKEIKYVYCAVRTDIPLGDQMCQVAHACLTAGKWFSHPSNANLVLLQVPNKTELLALLDKCKAAGIKWFDHDEPDSADGYDAMGQTAMATEAVIQSQRKHFRQYKLWAPL